MTWTIPAIDGGLRRAQAAMPTTATAIARLTHPTNHRLIKRFPRRARQ